MSYKKMVEELKPTAKVIYEALSEEYSMTIPELSRKVNKSRGTVRYHLLKMEHHLVWRETFGLKAHEWRTYRHGHGETPAVTPPVPPVPVEQVKQVTEVPTPLALTEFESILVNLSNGEYPVSMGLERMCVHILDNLKNINLDQETWCRVQAVAYGFLWGDQTGRICGEHVLTLKNLKGADAAGFLGSIYDKSLTGDDVARFCNGRKFRKTDYGWKAVYE